MKAILIDLARSYSGLASVALIVILLAGVAWMCDEYERRTRNRH